MPSSFFSFQVAKKQNHPNLSDFKIRKCMLLQNGSPRSRAESSLWVCEFGSSARSLGTQALSSVRRTGFVLRQMPRPAPPPPPPLAPTFSPSLSHPRTSHCPGDGIRSCAQTQHLRVNRHRRANCSPPLQSPNEQFLPVFGRRSHGPQIAPHPWNLET